MLLHQKRALNWMILRENTTELPPFWEKCGSFFINTASRNRLYELPVSVKGFSFWFFFHLMLIIIVQTPFAFPKGVDTFRKTKKGDPSGKGGTTWSPIFLVRICIFLYFSTLTGKILPNYNQLPIFKAILVCYLSGK